ncbi:MAG: hypothetical protein ACRDYB_17020, partial [Acidimicrobiales bacterium]
VLVVALVVALGGVAAGNRRLRSWVRSADKPAWLVDNAALRFLVAHRRPAQWGALAVGLVVLLLWDNPTPRIAVITAVIALAVVGLIGVLGRVSGAAAGSRPRR